MTSDRGTSGDTELQLDTPVAPKSPGLNPNATVFLSCKPGPGVSDTGQWEQQQQQQQQQSHSDSGIYLNSSSDYSYANGDVTVEKADATVFSPSTESTFQPEFATFTDNQAFTSDSNANIAAKLEETISRQLPDDQELFPADAPPPPVTFPGDAPPPATFPDGTVPMTGENYSSDNSANASDGEVPAGEGNVLEDQLRLALKNQLETYFSRENLSGDSYLQSQMDSDQYVPIATVANLDQVQRLTSDLQLIVELLRESTFVQVDEKGEKVRPNHNRCIVILREIPDTTPVQEVQGLFSGQNCPQFVSCEFAHNSNWYVTFDSDADAQRAYQYLREEVKTFLGKPIMARIKAKPLIRAYTPKNGYINKRFQQMQPQPSAPPLQEVPTSTAPQPQAPQPFPSQPFTLMPNVSQYHINGQQAIPFYPPPNPLLPNWSNNTMLDPSVVGTMLAINGYQPTVKVNTVPNRTPFPTNINRNNSRNQNPKMHSGRPMNQDRMPEPLPPRLSHQREQQQQQQQQQQQHNSCTANMHKTSPRNSEPTPISSHPSMYHTRRLENLNHATHPPMPHSMQPHQPHQPHQHPPPPHAQQPLSQHIDNNANNSVMLSSRPAPPADQLPLSQRYASKSYKSRRRRDEDGARPPRPNSQTSPSIPEPRPYDKQFDYEPTSFPPLPGACNNATSGDVFESKLSDVVRGTAKPQVRDTPKAVTTAIPSSTPTITSSASSSAIPATPHTTSKENKENIASSNHSNIAPSTSTPVASQQLTRSSVVTTASQPSVSPVVKATEKPVQPIASDPPTQKPAVVHTQSKIMDEKPTASQVKLSYAQMVQKCQAAEGGGAEPGDGSDSDPDTPLQHSNIANNIVSEQAQSSQSNYKSMSAISRSPAKDSFRKDRDFRNEEPREQRINSARRMKENRERRFDNRDTRDMRERERRVDRGGFERRDREREVPRTAVAK